MSRHFTPSEDARIREQYPDHDTAELARSMERPAKAVQRRAFVLGVRKSQAARNAQLARARELNHRWTEREDGLIRRFYPNNTAADVAGMCVNRTPAAAAERARRLGVSKTPEFMAAKLAAAQANGCTSWPPEVKRAHQARTVLTRRINTLARRQS